MGLYLGIDVGTQSVKALCYDTEQRRPVAIKSASLELISGADGSREQLADWWLTALQQCLSQFAPALRSEIKAIGVSGQQHGFVPLAADGRVLAPVKLWCDTATTIECAQINAAFGGDQRAIREVGNAILPGYTAPKIRWLKNHRPELYQQLDTILLPHDYLNYYLTGELAMECGDASGTGLFDIYRRQWHPGMLAAVDNDRDLRDLLPPLIQPQQMLGRLRPAAARDLGLPVGIPVAAGGGDNMMAAIGTGNISPGQLTISLGTSGTLFASSDTPISDSEGALAGFCSSTGGWLPLLCTMNCTVATELTRDLLQWSHADLEQQIASVPAGANGVITLPFFNGERTPNLPHGKGCILGLDADNYSAANLMRSAMESAVFGLRVGLDSFRRQGMVISSIRLTGGGAQNAVWRQAVADIFNLPVSVQQHDEGAALGAALQALWMFEQQTGSSYTMADISAEHLQIDPARCCEPNINTAHNYQHHFLRYQQHVAAITPLYRTPVTQSTKEPCA